MHKWHTEILIHQSRPRRSAAGAGVMLGWLAAVMALAAGLWLII